MPIKVQDKLPAIDVLSRENIFVMTESRAVMQDIRPLKIVILNLMPTKITTEIQLMRVLSNTALQVEVDLLYPVTHVSKNTSQDHLESFYKSFDEISPHKYDGMIVTGAPIETLDYEHVDYWTEITRIMEWSLTNVTSTLHICWGALAGLYYHYGVPKKHLEKKMSGVFSHRIHKKTEPLVRGFDDDFLAPHSRYTEVCREDMEGIEGLEIISDSDEAGIYIVMGHQGRFIFVTGHSEYDPLTLKEEYERDLLKGINPAVPKNYFPDDNPTLQPRVSWRSHAHLMFSNWLNYYVYQMTPYDISTIR